MRSVVWIVNFVLVLTIVLPTAAAPFTPGNVVISQVGDADHHSNANASPLHIKEISITDPDGTIVQDIPLPTFASGNNHRCTGTDYFRDHHLKLSTSGLFLTIGGYDCDLGIVTPNGDTTNVIPRVIARIDPFGIVDTSTTMTGAYYGANSTSGLHCVISTDGRNFWTAGRAASSSNECVRYETYGGTSSSRVNTSTQPRSVEIFNGQLYAIYNNSGKRGVHQIGTGLPTTSGQSTTWIADVTVQCPDTITFACAPNAGESGSPYELYWRDADTVYVTDDRTPGGNGGVLKFGRDTDSMSASFGQMIFRYVLNVGLRPLYQAVKTMAARPDGQGNLEIFVITAEDQGPGTVVVQNRLMRVVDTGCPGGGLQPDGTLLPCPETFTTLQTSPTGTDFRGVALAPRACVGAECIGQCCIPGGACQDTTQSGCSTLRGTWHGLGTTCATDTCPITCPIPFADADQDGDVDMDDFGAFQRCYSGDGVPVSGQCKCFDRPEAGFPTGDGDVDLTDLNKFMNCAHGAGVPADPTCGG